MRITNNITTQNALRTLQRGQQQVSLAMDRATTGLRFHRASEDPVAAAQVMRTGGSLRALDQYKRNVGSAQSRTAAEEGVLDQLSTVLMRANELAVSQATATATAETRQVVKAEVDQLLGFAISLGNTKHGDAFLFGGAQAAVTPFTLDESDPDHLDFTASGAGGEHTVEIAAGQMLSTNHDGTEVFGDAAGGPLAALRDLSRALGSNDQDAIGAASDAVKASLDDTQVLIGDIGARTNQLDITSSNLDALKITLTTFKSDLQEVDLEQALTELVGRQTAFQAAMMATSRVIGMNLTDYLR